MLVYGHLCIVSISSGDYPVIIKLNQTNIFKPVKCDNGQGLAFREFWLPFWYEYGRIYKVYQPLLYGGDDGSGGGGSGGGGGGGGGGDDDGGDYVDKSHDNDIQPSYHKKDEAIIPWQNSTVL